MKPTVEEELLQTVVRAILSIGAQAEALENVYYWATMSAKGHGPPETDAIGQMIARMAGKAQE